MVADLCYSGFQCCRGEKGEKMHVRHSSWWCGGDNAKSRQIKDELATPRFHLQIGAFSPCRLSKTNTTIDQSCILSPLAWHVCTFSKRKHEKMFWHKSASITNWWRSSLTASNYKSVTASRWFVYTTACCGDFESTDIRFWLYVCGLELACIGVTEAFYCVGKITVKGMFNFFYFLNASKNECLKVQQHCLHLFYTFHFVFR